MSLIAYIHIGLEKTGTTTLQEFFSLNREALKNDGYFYPTSPGNKNHINLAAFAFDRALGDIKFQKNILTPESKETFGVEFKSNFEKEIRENKNKSILVSSEHLSSRAYNKDEIRKLIRLFTNLNYIPKIIIYIRRQDQFLLSTYSTHVKCGATTELIPNAYKRRRYDYLTILNMWSEVVGIENMIVKVFEKGRMYNNDLIEDFLNILSITDYNPYKALSKRMNSSLDENKIEFLKSMNKYIPEFIEGKKNPLRGDLVQILESLESDNKVRLNSKLAQEIIEYYRKDNKEVKDKYLPNLKGELFDSTINNSQKQNDPEALTNDNIYNLFSKLWNNQQSVINQQNHKIKELSQQQKS